MMTAKEPMAAREQFAISLRKKKKQEILNLKRQRLIKASAHYEQTTLKNQASLSEEFSEPIVTTNMLTRVFQRLPSIANSCSADIWPVLAQIEVISL